MPQQISVPPTLVMLSCYSLMTTVAEKPESNEQARFLLLFVVFTVTEIHFIALLQLSNSNFDLVSNIICDLMRRC